MPKKLNCWEFQRCGREEGGVFSDEWGICPVTTSTKFDGINDGTNAGRTCWLVMSTSTRNPICNSISREVKACLQCDFMKKMTAGGDFIGWSKELFKLLNS